MMRLRKQLMAVAFLAMAGIYANGQNCNPTPLGWELPIENDTVISNSNVTDDSLMICDGKTVTYNSPQNTLYAYLEPNSELILEAVNSAIIHVKGNATLTIDTAYNGSVIYAYITYETGTSTLNDTSQLTGTKFYNPCSNVAFDYSNFPNGESPCPTVTGIKQNNSAGVVAVFPNPSAGQVMVRYGQNIPVRITDLIGREVASGFTNTSINLSEQPSGIYLVKVNGETHKLLLTD